MNARQKAKKYKRQLEMCKVNVNKIFIDKTDLIHFRTFYRVLPDSYYEHMSEDEKRVRVELEAKRTILHDLRDIVDTYTKLEVNDDTGDKMYTLDIWVKSK